MQLGTALLYGGLKAGGIVDDSTWSLDGTDWTEIDPASPPGPRDAHATAYDASRGVVVLFGGGTTGNEGVTWEFDGTSWIARSTPLQPETNRRWSPMAFDPVLEVVFLFGGQRGFRYNDTWAYGEDPDTDGRVGGLDNCRQTANPEQSNDDGDPAGNACDCAVADPNAFAVPGETEDVIVSDDGSTTTIGWDDQAPTAGDGVTYDVVTGELSDLRWTGSRQQRASRRAPRKPHRPILGFRRSDRDSTTSFAAGHRAVRGRSGSTEARSTGPLPAHSRWLPE